MKIGFDVSQTGHEKAGCGYFAEYLIRSLAKIDSLNSYLLYPTFGNFYWNKHYTQTVYVKQDNFSRGFHHTTFKDMKSFWNHPPETWEQQLGSPDIIHANNFFCPQGLKNAKLIYTLYDLSFMDYPEWTTEANRLGCFQGVFNASLYADHLIAISQYSKCHFLRIFPYVPEDKISVIYPASRLSFRPNLTRPHRLSALMPGRFWLSVGTLEPRKNHKNLLLAYARLKTMYPQIDPLVFAGGMGWLMQDFKLLIEELGLNDHVILLGYVSDDELQWLYQHCFCMVYPSFFEGFGLPVLEALTLKAPVITSHSSSLPEIVGAAAQLIDPYQVDSILEAMKIILQFSSEERERMIQHGVIQSQKFSWEKSAREVLEIYMKLV